MPTRERVSQRLEAVAVVKELQAAVFRSGLGCSGPCRRAYSPDVLRPSRAVRVRLFRRLARGSEGFRELLERIASGELPLLCRNCEASEAWRTMPKIRRSVEADEVGADEARRREALKVRRRAARAKRIDEAVEAIVLDPGPDWPAGIATSALVRQASFRLGGVQAAAVAGALRRLKSDGAVSWTAGPRNQKLWRHFSSPAPSPGA